jgi:hypothetical protein
VLRVCSHRVRRLRTLGEEIFQAYIKCKEPKWFSDVTTWFARLIAEKSKLDVTYLSGEGVDGYVKKIFSMTPEMKKNLRKWLNIKG